MLIDPQPPHRTFLPPSPQAAPAQKHGKPRSPKTSAMTSSVRGSPAEQRIFTSPRSSDKSSIAQSPQIFVTPTKGPSRRTSRITTPASKSQARENVPASRPTAPSVHPPPTSNSSRDSSIATYSSAPLPAQRASRSNSNSLCRPASNTPRRREETDLDSIYETPECRAVSLPDTPPPDGQRHPSRTSSYLPERATVPSGKNGTKSRLLRAISPYGTSSSFDDNDPPPQYVDRVRTDKADEDETRRVLNNLDSPTASAVATPRLARRFHSIRDLRNLGNQLADVQRRAPTVRGLAERVRPSAVQENAWLWMRERESGDEKGGILQMSAKGDVLPVVLLILDARRRGMKGPTLIVCSKDQLSNWRLNLKRLAPKLKICEYHGSNRPTSGADLKEYAAVITTINILQTEHSKAKHNGRGSHDTLMKMTFLRIFFDECLRIPKTGTHTFEACCTVEAQHRWLITYEPFKVPAHNRFLELLSVIPYEHEVDHVLLPLPTANNTRAERSLPVQTGSPNIEIRLLALEDAEYVFYLWIRNAISSQIQALLSGEIDSDDEVQDAYILLCRMVQACCQSNLWFKEQYLADFGEAACLVCLSTEARKTFESGVCINCMNALDDIPSTELTNPLFATEAPVALSTKLRGLVNLLFDIFEKTSQNSAGGGKVVICSQWSDNLTIVSNILDQFGIGAVNLDTIEPDEPTWAASLRKFRQDNRIAVALLHANVASEIDIDLSVANHIILLDVPLDPDVEDQCVDVIRRAGKTTRVTVWKLLMVDTIEVELQKLQSRKRGAGEPIPATDGHSSAGVTLQDLAKVIGLSSPEASGRSPGRSGHYS